MKAKRSRCAKQAVKTPFNSWIRVYEEHMKAAMFSHQVYRGQSELSEWGTFYEIITICFQSSLFPNIKIDSKIDSRGENQWKGKASVL